MNFTLPDHRRRTGSSNGIMLVDALLVLIILGLSFIVFSPLVRKGIYNYYLEESKPILNALVAAELRYFEKHGNYYSSPKNSEKDLEENLGIKLGSAGNFCFMVRTYAPFITDNSTGPINFEVWAILRDNESNSSSSNNKEEVHVQGFNTACLVADDKKKASFVFNSRRGRIFALREPTPSDTYIIPTTNAGPPRSGRSVARIEWKDGFTYSDIYK